MKYQIGQRVIHIWSGRHGKIHDTYRSFRNFFRLFYKVEIDLTNGIWVGCRENELVAELKEEPKKPHKPTEGEIIEGAIDVAKDLIGKI